MRLLGLNAYVWGWDGFVEMLIDYIAHDVHKYRQKVAYSIIFPSFGSVPKL